MTQLGCALGMLFGRYKVKGVGGPNWISFVALWVSPLFDPLPLDLMLNLFFPLHAT